MVAKLKADAEQRTSQLRSLVEKMMTKQGTAIANADSMWSFLADGNFTVDEETQKQAQADIAEDGYWGVEQTSDRILDFAKALSGNDPEKADLLIDAFKKGFEDATKSWGKDLPDISQRTYDAVLDKFDKWKNGSTTEAAGTETENFVNCCGLDADGHMTSANDIALMSRELITKYPKIHDYCTIWMENITHTTAKGSSEFGLTNTNKLIKHYQYATGLKTGFTNTAMYCISATAKKDDMELIAVIMGAPDIKSRSADATTLLNYGFGKCRIYCDSHEDKLDDLPVKKGLADSVGIIYQRPFQYMTTDGSDLTGITKSIELPENVTAPVKKGNTAGKAVYSLNGTPIGSVNIVYADTVDAADYKDYFCRTLLYFVP